MPESTARGKPLQFGTRCVAVDDPAHHDQYGSSSVPVYLTATFKGLPGAEFDYSRSGNPTRSVLQHHLSELQGCKYSYVLSSGMACLDVIARIVRPNDRVLTGDDLYGGSNRLLAMMRTTYDVHVDHIDTTNAATFEKHLAFSATEHAEGRSGPVSMVLLESPTNPLLKVCDLELLTRLVRQYAPSAVVVVDNTMLSPYLMRPLEFGVDIVYDSATKYLSGHHDIMAGVIACNRDDLAKRIAFTINSVGNALAPLDSFLLLRGVKTLALRMDRQQTNAMQVAQFLHGLGFHVNYPGLRSHPGYAVHHRLASGPGSVMSFETGNTELSKRITASVKLWGISVSFGCVNSLMSMPALMSHASIDAKVRAERGMPENLIRVCVGIEDVEDLMDDLIAALLAAGAIRKTEGGGYERVPIVDEMAEAREALRAQRAASEPKRAVPTTLAVSAPGKVILFGEHAVVHGVTAIAAATALRCYGRVAPRTDSKVRLEMPDIALEYEWAMDALPWGASTDAPQHLDTALLAQLDALCPAFEEGDRRKAACVAFLYLFVHLSTPNAAGQTFELRSSLPISAGLGSSAAVCTCFAALLLYTHNRIPAPVPEAPLPRADTTTVNTWAFLAEKVIHGEPSGVDNTVATHGGALAFTRAGPGNTLAHDKMEPIQGFDALRLLITDTGVSRDTKSLVVDVRAQKDTDPERVAAAFESIQLWADEAQSLLSPPPGVAPPPRATLLERLGRLIDCNHLQLVQLRVGHPSLETVRKTCAAAPYHLHTKLTGAGGGGCAITLLRDDLSDADLHALLGSLRALGCTTYETQVGGAGLGVLAEPAVIGHVLAPAFLQAPAAQLGTWATTCGTWVYA